MRVHGFRYYDPEIGRYLTRDPIGYGDGLNVYIYVGNNPINGIDPQGLGVIHIDKDDNNLLAVAKSVVTGGWEGYNDGRQIVQDTLTFGRIDSLHQAVSEKVEEGGGFYRAAQISATVGRSAGIGAGTGLGLGALGTAAAGGNAVAQVAQPVVQAGMAVMAAESAGQNAGNAVGAAEADNYGQAALYGTLAVADTVSAVAGARGLAQQIVGPASVPASVSPEGQQISAGAGAAKSTTWNEFQAATKGQFATRAEAGQAWQTYKEANGIVTGTTRSPAASAEYLKSLADDYRTPSWMKQWLQEGRRPPGYEVDHIKPLSVGGEDLPSNMRLQGADLHDIHHTYYRPWE